MFYCSEPCHEHKTCAVKGGFMPDMNRRMFVTTGASLLATSASMLLLREANAATEDPAHDRMQEPDGPSQPAELQTAGDSITTEEHAMNEEMARCIRLCHDCHTLCIHMIGHCLKLGGHYATPEHIRLLMDCAQMCETTADFMARESSLHDRLCGLCAELCRLCAESCQQTATDDQLMKQCVELCQRCAESCEGMSSEKTT